MENFWSPFKKIIKKWQESDGRSFISVLPQPKMQNWKREWRRVIHRSDAWVTVLLLWAMAASVCAAAGTVCWVLAFSISSRKWKGVRVGGRDHRRDVIVNIERNLGVMPYPFLFTAFWWDGLNCFHLLKDIRRTQDKVTKMTWQAIIIKKGIKAFSFFSLWILTNFVLFGTFLFFSKKFGKKAQMDSLLFDLTFEGIWILHAFFAQFFFQKKLETVFQKKLILMNRGQRFRKFPATFTKKTLLFV